jgi:hypothetical protein
MYFIRKTNSVHSNYFVGDLLIVRTDCVKELGFVLDSNLRFHCHVDSLHSQALKLLGLIRLITYKFSSLESLKVLCILLKKYILPKLEHESVIWNNLT